VIIFGEIILGLEELSNQDRVVVLILGFEEFGCRYSYSFSRQIKIFW
jgi:hypothetical protein